MKIHTANSLISRRNFLKIVGLTTASSTLCSQVSASIEKASSPKPVVVFWLSGGPSSMETFDPIRSSHGTATKGLFDSIPTTLPGVHVSGKLPLMAELMHEVSIVRTMNSKETDHFTAASYCLTSSSEIERAKGKTIGDSPPKHDSFGIRHAKDLRKCGDKKTLGYTVMNADPVLGLVGTLQPNDPNAFSIQYDFENQDYLLPFGEEFDLDRLNKKINLPATLTKDLDSQGLRNYDILVERAHALLASTNLADAFQLEKESDKIRQRYGNNALGNGTLIARRIVERSQGKTPIIIINSGPWDHHGNIEIGHGKAVPRLDQALSAFIRDMIDKGLDYNAFAMGEFDRTPYINENGGRDHWPNSGFLLGIGNDINEGQIIGKVSKSGYPDGPDGEFDAANFPNAVLFATGRYHAQYGGRFSSIPIFK